MRTLDDEPGRPSTESRSTPIARGGPFGSTIAGDSLGSELRHQRIRAFNSATQRIRSRVENSQLKSQDRRKMGSMLTTKCFNVPKKLGDDANIGAHECPFRCASAASSS